MAVMPSAVWANAPDFQFDRLRRSVSADGGTARPSFGESPLATGWDTGLLPGAPTTTRPRFLRDATCLTARRYQIGKRAPALRYGVSLVKFRNSGREHPVRDRFGITSWSKGGPR